MIRLLYNGGLRICELVTLRWRNLVEGVANVTGKGGVARLSRGPGRSYGRCGPRKSSATTGSPMSAVNAWKRVKRAARLAGITEVPVSPHFPRLPTARRQFENTSSAKANKEQHRDPDRSFHGFFRTVAGVTLSTDEQ